MNKLLGKVYSFLTSISELLILEIQTAVIKIPWLTNEIYVFVSWIRPSNMF